jgi:hypothetical protein
VVDATGATVDNEAELVAASARFSCPLAISYLAVSVQDLMAADTYRSCRAGEARATPFSRALGHLPRYARNADAVAPGARCRHWTYPPPENIAPNALCVRLS